MSEEFYIRVINIGVFHTIGLFEELDNTCKRGGMSRLQKQCYVTKVRPVVQFRYSLLNSDPASIIFACGETIVHVK